jgi:hypothetical protein
VKDKLLELLASESVLGMVVLVYEKGGTGPEGIICHSFANGCDAVPDIPGKLRALADKWELESGEDPYA